MALSLIALRAQLFLLAPTRRSDRGASVVEYALLLALIAVVCLVAVNTIGQPTKSGLEHVNNSGWGP